MTNATITLRKATPKDAADLAIIDNMASRGMSLAFWQHAVTNGEGEDALVFARERFEDEASIFGWKNATVAEDKVGILGAVTTYQMEEPDDDIELIKKLFPSFVPVFELFAKAVGDWFIDSLGTFTKAREQGVADRLVDQALTNGRNAGLDTVALVVESENKPALRLYEKKQFESVESLPMIGENANGNWLLLKRPL